MGRFLNTPAGHALVALFVFLVGVGLVLAGRDIGDEIVFGALASLWTAIQLRGQGPGPRGKGQ